MGNSASHSKLKSVDPKTIDVEGLSSGAETPDKDQMKVLPHDPRSPSDGILRTPIQISDNPPGEICDQKLLLDGQLTPTAGSRNRDMHGCSVPASQRFGPPYYVKDLESMDGVESDGDVEETGDSHLIKTDTRPDRANDPAKKVKPSHLPLRFGLRGSRDPGSPSDIMREKQRRECSSTMKENNPPARGISE